MALVATPQEQSMIDALDCAERLLDYPPLTAVEEIPDPCPAGGDHTPGFLTAWDQGVGVRDPQLRAGWFCEECLEELPAPDCEEP